MITIGKIDKPNKIKSIFKKEWITLLLITAFGILYNIGMLANPFFEGKLVDLIENKKYVDDFSVVYRIVFIFVLSIFLTQFVRGLKRYFVRKFAFDVSTSMRLIVYNNILHMSEKELSTIKIGTLISRNMSDIDKAVEGMRKFLTEIFDTALLFLIYIVYLFCFDSVMTLFSLIPVVCGVIVAFLFRKLNFKMSSLSRSANSKLNSKTFDLMKNGLTYRIYGRDEENLKEYDTYLKEYEHYNKYSQFVSDTMMPISNMIALIGLIPLMYLGSKNVINSSPLNVPFIGFGETNWTIGMLTTYLTTFVLLSNKTGHTAKLFSSVESGLASWNRIKPHIHDYEEYKVGQKIESDSTALVFKDYSLILDSKLLINKLNIEMNKGQIIGVTGPIASGKSVFLKSLIQLIPYEGNIYLCDKELSLYHNEEISSNITYMGHRSELFTESIRKNISFDSDKDVTEFLKIVSFDKDLESMDDKENSIVGNEGVKLSGGQQQRIALARSLYHKKNILLLDDPFASVDQKTELEIVSRLNEMKKDCLIILVSHRLNAFPYLDNIIVLHGDGNYDIGKHEELLSSSVVYSNLWNIQKETKEVKDE